MIVKNNSVVSKMPISSSNMSANQLMLFSIIFLALGGYIIGVSLDLFPFKGRINAPMEIVFLGGLVFFMAGISVLFQGITRKSLIKYKSMQFKKFRGSPWLWDYKWNKEGINTRSKNSMLGHFVGVSIMSSFMGITYWIGFILRDGFKLPFYAMCFFSIFILFWFYTMISKRIRYGRPALGFSQFPFYLGRRLNIKFINLPPSKKVKNVIVTIRFYEEIFSKNLKNQTVITLKELYSDTLEFPGTSISSTRDMDASFSLPSESSFVSSLSEAPAKFWEAQIQCDIDGWDYREYYLLPVYK